MGRWAEELQAAAQRLYVGKWVVALLGVLQLRWLGACEELAMSGFGGSRGWPDVGCRGCGWAELGVGRKLVTQQLQLGRWEVDLLGVLQPM